jgi:hypothetical protein
LVSAVFTGCYPLVKAREKVAPALTQSVCCLYRVLSTVQHRDFGLALERKEEQRNITRRSHTHEFPYQSNESGLFEFQNPASEIIPVPKSKLNRLVYSELVRIGEPLRNETRVTEVGPTVTSVSRNDNLLYNR